LRPEPRVRAASRPATAALVLGLLVASAPAAAEPPALAVLPFTVHSARPIGYLGESVSNLLRSRVEAAGDTRVVGAARVRAALAGGPVDASDAGLRALAGELGADWVVTGSLTELAGRYSLDVQVVPARVGVRSQSLVLTAATEDDLMARVNEAADQIVEQVARPTPARVAAVVIAGGNGLAEELRPVLQTREGQPYDPTTVRNDLTALRADRRVARASAETERGDEGVRVRFVLVPSARAEAGPEGPVRVAEVRVRGNRRIEADAIKARVVTRPGSAFSRRQLAEDVRQIHALGFFRNVRVFTETVPEGRVVIFEVEENPIVRQISIAGNDSIEGERIRDVLTLTTGSTLDEPLLFENRQRIQAVYRAEGFYLAEVSYEVEPLSETSVAIHFEVAENEKLKLQRIEFSGNEAFTDDELREGFKTKVWRFWSIATSWFDKSGTYSEPLFMQDLRLVEKKYTDAGYLQVEIEQPDVVPSEGELVVRVPIEEGPRFSVGSVGIEGDITTEIAELEEDLLLKEGEVFNRSHLSQDVGTLTERYQNQGFYFANVTPVTDLSRQELVVDVAYRVEKGPLYFVREIDIQGNTTTIDPVIRREIPLVEGQLYSQRAVQIARARIQGTGFFEEVDFELETTDDPEQLKMNVNVVEKPTGSFSFGAGFSSQDSFVGTGSLSQSNLFGRGYAIQASVDFGAETQRFFLNFVDPYLFGSSFSLSTTAFRTSLQFEDFEQERTGVEVVLGHPLTEDNRGRGFLRYSLASRSLTEDEFVNASAPIFREILEDSLTTSLVGLSFVLDRRDDRLAPTDGYQLGGALELAGLGGFSQFVRAEARFQWFLGVPDWMPFLSDKSTFVFGIRGGYAFPLNSIGDFVEPGLGVAPDGTADTAILAMNSQAGTLGDIDTDSTLPLSERYFLGGLGPFQLRGFKARSVGPRRPVLLRSGGGGAFVPVGRRLIDGEEMDEPGVGGVLGGDLDGEVNDIDDEDIDDFDDLDETDVIGGNKFISTSFEYRFPISETFGLQGLAFLDTGNAFAEGENPFNVLDWRYGTGVGVRWFSPFGPLAVILGFPIDKLDVEDSPVFEFSVGSGGF